LSQPRYLEDYEGFNEHEHEVFKLKQEEKAEVISQNPISIFRMLRRFVVNFRSISPVELNAHITKGE